MPWRSNITNALAFFGQGGGFPNLPPALQRAGAGQMISGLMNRAQDYAQNNGYQPMPMPGNFMRRMPWEPMRQAFEGYQQQPANEMPDWMGQFRNMQQNQRNPFGGFVNFLGGAFPGMMQGGYERWMPQRGQQTNALSGSGG